ncbi:MAG: hypothetical protein D6808_04845, partial [Candidatus Dadabacteria bacterium]
TLKGTMHWLEKGPQPEDCGGVFIKPEGPDMVSQLIDAIEYFISQENRFDSDVITSNGARFSVERFIAGWNAVMKRHGLPVGALAVSPQEELEQNEAVRYKIG